MQELKITFCTYFESINEFRYESEIYSEYTLFCLKSGSFYYRVGSDIKKVLSDGEMVICPPGQAFWRKIIKEASLLMIKFTTTEEISFTSNSVKCFDFMRLNYDIKKLEECLFCTDMEKNPQYEHFCRDIIYLATDTVLRNMGVAQIQSYMQENYAENIKISFLAEKAGYSVAQFINVFKRYYHRTPKQYIAEIRLKKAKELLITTNKKSREIALLCGFNDELYFIRFFKKHTGISPTSFRKSIVASDDVAYFS